jgi:hypothetical protein
MIKTILEVMHIWVSYFVNVETSKSYTPNFAVVKAGGQSWADDQSRYQNLQHFELHNCKIFECKDMKFIN